MINLIPFAANEPDVFDYFDAFNHFMHTPVQQSKPSYYQCKTDIAEYKDYFEVACELPGFDKKEIKIDIKDNTLSITAEHEKEEKKVDEQEQTDNEYPQYVRRERSMANFKRSFNLEQIDTNGVKANYENGILTIKLPKEMPKNTESISIDVA